MLELDQRLREGPLPVASLFQPARADSVARESLRRRRRSWLRLAGTAVCGVGLLAVLVWRAWLPAATPSARPPALATIRFADGSTAVPTGQGAQVQIDEQSAQRVAVRLRGAARFEVTPDRARAFEVRSRAVLVRVLGTAFTVDGRSERTRVAVERGRVEVRWPGGSAILEPGDEGRFPPAEPAQQASGDGDVQRMAVETALQQLSVGAGPDARAGDPRATSQRGAPAQRAEPGASERVAQASGVRGGQWRDSARRGDYSKAYEQLDQERDDPAQDAPADLMLAADVARLSGHPTAAIAPLRALCIRFPRDKRAPVAAFTLGRVLLDDLARADEAAEAFARARELWPAGPLSEDALAREAEAWSRAERAERAHAAALRYQQRFPHGRHAEAVRRFLIP